MTVRVWVAIREATAVSFLLGFGGVLVVFESLFGIGLKNVAIFGIVLFARAYGVYHDGEATTRRQRLWAEGFQAVAAGCFGAILFLGERPLAATAAGVLFAWSVLEFRAIRRLGPPYADEKTSYESLQRVVEALSGAERPLSADALASTTTLDDEQVSLVLAHLRERGHVERRNGGYVANNVYLGPRFSLLGLVRRLTRPVRALGPSRHV